MDKCRNRQPSSQSIGMDDIRFRTDSRSAEHISEFEQHMFDKSTAPRKPMTAHSNHSHPLRGPGNIAKRAPCATQASSRQRGPEDSRTPKPGCEQDTNLSHKQLGTSRLLIICGQEGDLVNEGLETWNHLETFWVFDRLAASRTKTKTRTRTTTTPT